MTDDVLVKLVNNADLDLRTGTTGCGDVVAHGVRVAQLCIGTHQSDRERDSTYGKR